MLQKLRELMWDCIKRDRSIVIHDIELIARCLANPDFPWFISFPRTGSHWLRMIMELYFEKPSLVRVFYYRHTKDFTCFHRHDTELSLFGCRNVLYLYRDPVDTIFSQLNYGKENINNRDRIQYWATLYGKHLAKWLLEETFTVHKTVITYEGMQKDMFGTFKMVCNHFKMPFDKTKLDTALQQVSKEALQKKVLFDASVVNTTAHYDTERRVFREKYSDMIYAIVHAQHKDLKDTLAG